MLHGADKKMILDRIQSIENHFGELCTELSSFTKKKAKLRDKYDELSRVFKNYAEAELFNETLANGLSSYSKALTLLGDIQDIEVQRLQSKIVRELAGYESICKNTKEIIRHSILIRDKELNRKQHIEQIKQRTQQRNATSMDNDQNTQNTVATKSGQELEANFLNFERQKLSDIKQLMMDFTLIQLKELVKSMEVLTAAYNDIAAIDVDKDLQKQSNHEPKTLQQQNRSQSMSALSSIAEPSGQSTKRSNLTNSTFSLDSPDKVCIGRRNGKVSPTNSISHSDEVDETSESEDETSSSEGDDSQMIKQNSYGENNDDNGDEENTVVPKRPNKVAENERDLSAAKKCNGAPVHHKRQSNAPVPQVRFSKLAQHASEK